VTTCSDVRRDGVRGHRFPSRKFTARASTVQQQLDELLLTAVNLHHDRYGDYLQVRLG
jgi:hypothetical protein